MSDASFDTSAADTLTSGLSLGQFIKNVAEEAQPLDRWYQLQPTVEKEWHTLQGESVLEDSVVNELTEVPLSDISTLSTMQEVSNPVASLIKQSKNQKKGATSGSNLMHLPSTSLATPAITTSKQSSKLPENYPHDYFTTPALSYQHRQGAEKYSFTATPLTTKPRQQRPGVANESQLSAQDISSFLEKDDSIAQRVIDLLEDNVSLRSNSSDVSSKRGSDKGLPTLLRSMDRKAVETQHSGSSTASEQIRKDPVAVSDTGMSSSNEMPSSGNVLDQTNKMMKTLNLFSDSGFNVGNLSGISNLGDPLESLNASAATEYGDLPETVDIPKDIVHRLNNMRKIIQQQPDRSSSDSTSSHSLQSIHSTQIQTTSSSVSTCSTAPSVVVTSSTKPAPISGDVRYHTGSNPTTPQFPVEEEKLQQLQSYIEKKTGVPTVSPLVVGDSASAKAMHEPNTVSTTQYKRLPVSDVTPMTVGSAISSAGTSSLLAATPLMKHELDSPHLGENKQENVTPNPTLNPLQFDSSQRCDPEGMSPPINSATAPLASGKSAAPIVSTSTTTAVQNTLVTSEDEKRAVEDKSYLSENLSDESLLARLKSALSDSVSLRPEHGEKSDISLTSSIDSLGAHIKALLKDEVPKLVSSEEHEVSNLSEAIENFEHTELWKFVAQFLPSATSGQVTFSGPSHFDGKHQSYSGVREEQNDTLTESTLDNSILERIRAGLRRSSLQDEPSVESASTSQKYESRSTSTTPQSEFTEQSEEQQAFPPRSIAAVVPTSTYIKPHNSAPIEGHLHIIDEEPLSMDPIPGIPDFSRSVVQHSSPTGPFLRQTSPYQTTFQQPKAAWPEKDFSRYKQSAKTMITNQLDRASRRDFDVSLTPAKHSTQFLSEKTPTVKNDQYASRGDRRNAGVSTSGRRSPTPPRSAYFKKQNVPTTSSASNTGSLTRDSVPSSHETPSSILERNDQRQSISSRKTTPCSQIPSHSKPTPSSSGANARSASVTPMMSSGFPSASKHVTLMEPQRSAPPSFENRSYERNRSPTRGHQSRSEDFGTPSRRKSPLRDRETVQDWLKSPERKRRVEEQKHLPTFQELMEIENKELEEKVEKESRSLQERDLNARNSHKTHSMSRDPLNSFADNSHRSKKLDFEKSSLRPQLDVNDSYQQASLNTGELPTAMSRSSLPSDDSDVNIQRRMVNQTLSDTEFQSKLKKVPKTVSEFQSMDEKAQEEFLRQVMVWVNRKRRSLPKDEGGKPDPTPTTSTSASSSLLSNNAVCDSDSTEYCDLPSTRPATANTLNNSSLRSIDDANAEKLLKKLLERIKKQKDLERQERKKPAHRRTAASSSTPQKRRPPLPVPEASSIASTGTDTDAGGKYYIQVRDRRHHGPKKVAYVGEASESEPTAFVRIKRKPKKAEALPERIVLHDRSVQTESSIENASSQSTLVTERTPRHQEKKSKAIQTSAKFDVHDKENKVASGRRKSSQAHQELLRQRSSSFFVDFNNGEKRTKQPTSRDNRGPVKLTLREALASQNPQFISHLRERQRRIAIHSDERRLQEIWEEERQRMFGQKNETKPKRTEPQRRGIQLTRKQFVAETRKKYEQLPEVVKKREEEQREREYESNRFRAKQYNKKVQNKVLGRYFA